MEDRQIIDLYFQRSEKAIEETDIKYGKYCFSIAYHILANREDSEESVNDTYLAAWNAIPPQRPPFFAPFLGKITRNISIDHWRFKYAEKRGSREFPLCLEELTNCASGEPSIEQEAMLKETTEAINRFLQDLPKIQRMVFIRRYWYIDSVSEIAQTFGFSQTKVTTMLYRIRAKLRHWLEQEGLL